MVKVTNTSDTTQAVSGIPKFAAGETKDVTPEIAEHLSHNDNFVVESWKVKDNVQVDDTKPAKKSGNK